MPASESLPEQNAIELHTSNSELVKKSRQKSIKSFFNIPHGKQLIPQDELSIFNARPMPVIELINLILDPTIDKYYDDEPLPNSITYIKNLTIPTKTNGLDLKTVLEEVLSPHARRTTKGEPLYLRLSAGNLLGGFILRVLNADNPYSYYELSKIWDELVTEELNFSFTTHTFPNIGKRLLQVLFALGNVRLPKEVNNVDVLHFTNRKLSCEYRLRLIRERWQQENDIYREPLKFVGSEITEF